MSPREIMLSQSNPKKNNRRQDEPARDYAKMRSLMDATFRFEECAQETGFPPNVVRPDKRSQPMAVTYIHNFEHHSLDDYPSHVRGIPGTRAMHCI